MMTAVQNHRILGSFFISKYLREACFDSVKILIHFLG